MIYQFLRDEFEAFAAIEDGAIAFSGAPELVAQLNIDLPADISTSEQLGAALRLLPPGYAVNILEVLPEVAEAAPFTDKKRRSR